MAPPVSAPRPARPLRAPNPQCPIHGHQLQPGLNVRALVSPSGASGHTNFRIRNRKLGQRHRPSAPWARPLRLAPGLRAPIGSMRGGAAKAQGRRRSAPTVYPAGPSSTATLPFPACPAQPAGTAARSISGASGSDAGLAPAEGASARGKETETTPLPRRLPTSGGAGRRPEGWAREP
jgi:hypothetical protein